MAAAAAKSRQSCPTLCDPINGSPPGSPVPRILQVRILEWVAISFSKAWKWKVKVKSLSRVRLLASPWTAAYQAPPSIGFSRQEYRSGVPLTWLLIPTPHHRTRCRLQFQLYYGCTPAHWKWGKRTESMPLYRQFLEAVFTIFVDIIYSFRYHISLQKGWAYVDFILGNLVLYKHW